MTKEQQKLVEVYVDLIIQNVRTANLARLRKALTKASDSERKAFDSIILNSQP